MIRIEIAFPEVEGNFVERALFPFFGFGEPEHSTLGIMRRALTAEIFLAADFNEPVHETPLLREANSRASP
jgi:hypothetical protein